MKTIKIGFFFSFLYVLFNSCVSTAPVYHVTSGSPPKSAAGIYYALPKTVITADFVVSRTEITKGKYAEYADLLLGIKELPAEGVKFKIEEAKIGNYSVVDTSQWYFIDLKKNGLLKKSSVSITMTANGIISNGNVEVENKTVDYVIEVVEVAASVAAKIIPFASVAPASSFNFDKFSDIDGVLNPKIKTPTKLDSAREVVDLLKEIETRRLNLISNKTGSQVSPEVLQLMLKELNAKKEELLSLFVGEKTVKSVSLHFKTSDTTKTVFFIFSEKKGLHALPANMNVNPVFLNSSKEGDEISLQFGNSQALPSGMTNSASSKKKSSFYYRIPVNTEVSLYKGSRIISQAEFPIAQKGTIKSLPIRTGGMKTKYELKYDPQTGALLEVKLNGEPISDATLDKIAAAGEKVLEVVKPDELSELEKQRKILEEKKKIKELQGTNK